MGKYANTEYLVLFSPRILYIAIEGYDPIGGTYGLGKLAYCINHL